VHPVIYLYANWAIDIKPHLLFFPRWFEIHERWIATAQCGGCGILSLFWIVRIKTN
jgi:hypothetical protein